MKHSSLESSHRGSSNDNRNTFLALIDDKLDVLRRIHDISPSSDCKKIKNSSLESSHCDGSNGSKIAFLAPLEGGLALLK